ncbi:hypothetical protein [Halostagnicola bangensis]
MRRRRFLGLAAGIGAGVTAGCLDSEEEYATLEGIRVLNMLDGEPSVDLRVERENDDSVYEERLEVTGEIYSDDLLECDWPDEPLRVLSKRHDEAEWNVLETNDHDGCVSVSVWVDERGTGYYVGIQECPHSSHDCAPDEN